MPKAILGKIATLVNLDIELKRKIKAQAASEGITMNEWIERCLKKEIEVK